jgi:hypothetical protein
MLNRWQFWLLTALAALNLLLGALNASLFVGNRNLQAEVAGRQQFILQSMQLQGLYTEIAQALADLSTRTKDEDLRRILEARGITISVTPPAPAQASERSKEGR